MLTTTTTSPFLPKAISLPLALVEHITCLDPATHSCGTRKCREYLFNPLYASALSRPTEQTHDFLPIKIYIPRVFIYIRQLIIPCRKRSLCPSQHHPGCRSTHAMIYFPLERVSLRMVLRQNFICPMHWNVDMDVFEYLAQKVGRVLHPKFPLQ